MQSYVLFCRKNDLRTFFVTKNDLRTFLSRERFTHFIRKVLRIEFCHPESSDFLGLWFSAPTTMSSTPTSGTTMSMGPNLASVDTVATTHISCRLFPTERGTIGTASRVGLAQNSSLLRCGSEMPSWMSRSHPYPEYGIVTRKVCSQTLDNTCKCRKFVDVLNCDNGFFVYSFENDHWYHGTYCSD